MACVTFHVLPLLWFLLSTTFLSCGTHTVGVPDRLWLPCRLARSRSIADSCQVVDNKQTVTTRQWLACAHKLIHHITFAEIMTWDLGAVQQHILCHQSRVHPTLQCQIHHFCLTPRVWTLLLWKWEVLVLEEQAVRLSTLTVVLGYGDIWHPYHIQSNVNLQRPYWKMTCMWSGVVLDSIDRSVTFYFMNSLCGIKCTS